MLDEARLIQDRVALERFELVMKATYDLIWDWNITEGVLWWNDHFKEWFGFEKEEEGRELESWNRRIHAEDKGVVLESVDAAIQAGKTHWSGEYRFLRLDGTFAHVHDRAYIVYKEGKPVRMVGSMQDISDIIRVQKRQREAEEERSFAMEAAEIGTWVFYPLTHQVKWDERCKRFFGFTKADIVSFDLVLKYIHEEDVERVSKAVRAALDPATTGRYDIRFRTVGAEDKRLRWLHCKGQTYFNAEQIAYRFAGTAQDITEQVAARRKAESTEKIAHLAIERAGAGTFHVDLISNTITYSATCARILTGTEATGDHRDIFIKYVHPEDRWLREEAYSKALQTGELYYESRFVWEDGSIHAVKTTGMYGFDTAGKPIDFSGIVQDITEEVLSRQEQRKLLTLVENSGNYKAVSDEAGNIIYMNHAGRALLGIAPDGALPPLNMNDFYRTEQLAGINEQLLSDVAERGVWSGNVEIKQLQTGERIPCHADIRAIYDPVNGRFIGRGATLHDLRPELAARRELEESEKRFRILVMTSPIPIGVYIGREMRIQLVNQAILDAWEKDGSVVGKTFAEALPELAGQPFLQKLEEVYTTGVPYEGKQERVELMRNGQLQTTYYNFAYTPLRDETGTVYGVLNTAVEVTREKLYEQELEQQVDVRTQELQATAEELQATSEELQATNEELTTTNEELNEANVLLHRSNRELEQYAFVASHDLQEPLRKIRLYAGMVHNFKGIPDGAGEMLFKIIDSAERMSVLIRDLLEFSRLMKYEKALGLVDMNIVLHNVLSDFEVTIQEKAAVIDYNVLPVIEAEPLQINQLIFNLVGNALKFTRKEVAPHIVITARELSAREVRMRNELKTTVIYYAIAVADNGIGFDIRFADQIFEVFKRLHTRDSYPGSGIGLALCRKIVQNHNGLLEVQSVEGEGTTITIIIPAIQSDNAATRG